MRHYTPGLVSRTFAALLLLSALFPFAAKGADAPSGPGGSKVGPETCKACHQVAYELWRAGPHARSQEGLPQPSRKDPRCLSCHAPDAEAGLDGVTCEACHGPGGIYSAPYVMRDPELAHAVGLAEPGERTCVTCHGESAPSLVRFEYLKKLPLIDHWTRERQAAGVAGSGPLASPPTPGK